MAEVSAAALLYGNLPRYLKAACLPPSGVHIFRHSAAKLRRDAGESVEEVIRNRVLAGNYGMSLEDDYKPLLKAHNGPLALLKKQHADKHLAAEMVQVQRAYESDLDRAEGV